ncbi:unnamed protein product [Nesidiocoris tenuis]|uniref:Uncharacterized protein n=1 Tax=Nesidiocoris tenuis TaxID=355587 RepID=A0A6H5FXF9_9HEMI|nr:unnamed protein product [Nesidiocoris tenuis]
MNREARSSKPSGGSKKSPSRTRSSSRSRKTKPKEKTPEPKVRSKSKTRRSPSRSRGRPRKRTSTSPDVVTNSIQNVVERLASIIVTAAVLIGVKLYTTFPIVKLLDMSLPILTTSILTAIVLSVALYVKAVYQKTANHDYGKTGNVLYDIFAGAEVNPRVGPLDVKTALLRTALITTIIYDSLLIYKEVDGKGLAQISVNAVLVAALQIVFSLDFVIFESDLLSSFTVNQDGTGLLLLLHGALFPFWITLLPKYLYLSRTPHNVWLSSIAGVVFLIGYIIHRISNHQKRKVKKDSSAVPSKDVIHSRSSVLYKGGLWGLVRHPNYLGALIIYSSWSVLALAAAPVHWIPVAISVVNLVEIATQIARVESRSEERHGAIWNSYAAQVKYRILPRHGGSRDETHSNCGLSGSHDPNSNNRTISYDRSFVYAATDRTTGGEDAIDENFNGGFVMCSANVGGLSTRMSAMSASSPPAGLMPLSLISEHKTNAPGVQPIQRTPEKIQSQAQPANLNAQQQITSQPSLGMKLGPNVANGMEIPSPSTIPFAHAQLPQDTSSLSGDSPAPGPPPSTHVQIINKDSAGLQGLDLGMNAAPAPVIPSVPLRQNDVPPSIPETIRLPIAPGLTITPIGVPAAHPPPAPSAPIQAAPVPVQVAPVPLQAAPVPVPASLPNQAAPAPSPPVLPPSAPSERTSQPVNDTPSAQPAPALSEAALAANPPVRAPHPAPQEARPAPSEPAPATEKAPVPAAPATADTAEKPRLPAVTAAPVAPVPAAPAPKGNISTPTPSTPAKATSSASEPAKPAVEAVPSAKESAAVPTSAPEAPKQSASAPTGATAPPETPSAASTTPQPPADATPLKPRRTPKRLETPRVATTSARRCRTSTKAVRKSRFDGSQRIRMVITTPPISTITLASLSGWTRTWHLLVTWRTPQSLGNRDPGGRECGNCHSGEQEVPGSSPAGEGGGTQVLPLTFLRDGQFVSRAVDLSLYRNEEQLKKRKKKATKRAKSPKKIETPSRSERSSKRAKLVKTAPEPVKRLPARGSGSIAKRRSAPVPPAASKPAPSSSTRKSSSVAQASSSASSTPAQTKKESAPSKAEAATPASKSAAKRKAAPAPASAPPADKRSRRDPTTKTKKYCTLNGQLFPTFAPFGCLLLLSFKNCQLPKQ